MLEALHMLSLPGNPAKPNDDAFCHSNHLAAVFDGATGLGEQILPVDSDAAWIARRGTEGLILHESENPRETLRAAASDAEIAFNALRQRPPAETYEIPFASMMFITERANTLEALWFGDCAALIKRPGENVQIIGDAMQKRTEESARVAALAKARNLAPTAGPSRTEYLPALRAARNRVNTKDGSWLFSPDASCADHAHHQTIPAPKGTDILLLTDGFLALTSDYNRYTTDALLDAAQKGLRPLYNELREIEFADPEGRNYPRFKQSDDATAILLRVV